MKIANKEKAPKDTPKQMIHVKSTIESRDLPIEMINASMENMTSKFAFYHSQPIVQSNAQTYCRTEQFSYYYISSLCKQNLYNEVLVAFDFLQNNANFRIRPSTYADLIFVCFSLRSLQLGRKVHDNILLSKCQPDVVLHNHILNMYGKYGSLEDARMVFYEMPLRNVVSWTAMIAGRSQNGQENDTIELYIHMLQSGAMPNRFTFGSIIRACSGLCCVGLGRQLHAHVIKSEHDSHLISQNALIAMYTKFDRILDAWNVFSSIARKDITSWGSMIAAFSKLDSARIVFNEIESPDLASWNAIIAGVARAGCVHEADDFINQMAFEADIVASAQHRHALLKTTLEEIFQGPINPTMNHPSSSCNGLDLLFNYCCCSLLVTSLPLPTATKLILFVAVAAYPSVLARSRSRMEPHNQRLS
ncbi:pentatricopeptide repeat-containing protein [Citrus sinensis]|uniref:Pentatricopeptide repeat-containing protein n=1 Tax=Citrus sinensis TaxID=2711 RepID=A0ACB8JS11_CITSI|nr:pentatricopeptide repeat-containing protein [Citrus sinensis]